MPQKNWDKYEVALLIEAYQDIKQARTDKSSALVSLSQNLRKIARNEGLEIDDTFRNINGMKWQLGFIEKAFVGENYESRTPPHVFIEMVELYNQNRQEYQAILDEAHGRIVAKTEASDEDQKDLFAKWIYENTSYLPPTVIDNITFVSVYANNHGSKKDFWSYRSYKEFNVARVKISGNKLFKVLNGKEHRQFEKFGKLYSDFLKEYYKDSEPVVQHDKQHPQGNKQKDEDVTESNKDALHVHETPSFDDVAISEKVVVPETRETVLDFNSIPDLSYTKPTYVAFKDVQIEALSWNTVYVSVLGLLYNAYSGRLDNYLGKSLCGGTRVDLSLRRSGLKSPKLVAPNYMVYAETNLSANGIAKRLDSVLRICAVPRKQLIIKYKKIESIQNAEDRNASTGVSAVQKNVLSNREAILEEYAKWLLNERGMSQSTSRGYGSNLKMADTRIQEFGIINGSLFDLADDKLQETVGAILSDSRFSKYNSEQHNRFSAALQAYLLYKIGVKATTGKARKTRRLKEAVICPAELKALLLRKFPYGIRVDSAIDMMKLKNFAEMFDVELTEKDELLQAQIAVAGISYERKIYFISDEVYAGIVEKINSIFAEGYSVVYYEEFFSKNFDWFDEHHISSWELVREILDKRGDDIYVSRNLLRKGTERITEADAVEQELERVWGDEVIHTYDEMYERLPYIPDEKIKFYLSYSKKFVWSANETFAWIDKVVIAEDEKQAIIDYVTNECIRVGHASIANVPLGNIEEENYQISISAVYDAIYNLILKDCFAINGKILTPNDNEVDALTLAKAYCDGKDVMTFTELNDYVTSINGTMNRQITLRAAYDQMVRVEENKFVADKLISFNIDAIDELLEEIVSSDFASIKSVATFIMFPNCGFAWTHYIIESFCYRFSKKFRLEVINFNDKNAGIIVKKDVKLSFADMLAIVADKSGLDLKPELIGQYLFDNGYVARRKMPLIDNAVEKAIQIREGR